MAKGLRLVQKDEIKQIEPNCVVNNNNINFEKVCNYIYFCCCKGVKAIHSPNTGIVDWGFVAKHFGRTFQQNGGKIILNFEADRFVSSPDPEYPIRIVSKNNVIINFIIYCRFMKNIQRFENLLP